jgi:hypothetical protein
MLLIIHENGLKYDYEYYQGRIQRGVLGVRRLTILKVAYLG